MFYQNIYILITELLCMQFKKNNADDLEESVDVGTW